MVNVAIIYAACVAGAIGVYLMLPRRGSRLGPLGGLLAAGALGAAFIAVATHADASTQGEATGPGTFFYIFSLLAAGGAIRMISHPRPVYAALYFILVVLSIGGMFLLLAAEFMAFALVIVYAGAILVTYLFVIMLAQEAPDDQHADMLADYDANAREPIAAVTAGFLLLAALLGVMYRGTAAMHLPEDHAAAGDHGAATVVEPAFPPELAILTGRVETALRDAELIGENEHVASVDPVTGVAIVRIADTSEGRTVAIPDTLVVENVDQIGTSLMAEFAVSLELAGVILLLAMLGAVVLARNPIVVADATPSEGGAAA